MQMGVIGVGGWVGWWSAVRSVVDDDGASHPQAGVRVRRGQDQSLRRPLRDPA